MFSLGVFVQDSSPDHSEDNFGLVDNQAAELDSLIGSVGFIGLLLSR